MESDDKKSSCDVRLLAVKQTNVGTVWIWIPENEKVSGFGFADLNSEAQDILESVHSPLKTSTIAAIIKTADEQILKSK